METKKGVHYEHKGKYICIPANMSYNEYLYGDFNNNRIKNVDDPHPFMKNEPKPRYSKAYFHKAQYVGGDIKMSEALKMVERHNNANRPLLMSFLRRYPGSEGRIKTVPSTIYKLESQYGTRLKDRAGVRILSDTRPEVYANAKRVRQKEHYNPRYTRDYYKMHIPNKTYYAIHLDLFNPQNRKQRIEAQFKTKTMSQISDVMHVDYKKGRDLKKYKPMVKREIKAGMI